MDMQLRTRTLAMEHPCRTMGMELHLPIPAMEVSIDPDCNAICNNTAETGVEDDNSMTVRRGTDAPRYTAWLPSLTACL